MKCCECGPMSRLEFEEKKLLKLIFELAAVFLFGRNEKMNYITKTKYVSKTSFFRRNRTGFDESFSKTTFMTTMTNFEKDIFESGNLQRDRNYEMIITFQKKN